MQIKEIMTKDVITVRPDMPLKNVGKLFKEKRISGVPVIDKDDAIVGIVTITDMMKLLKDIHNWKQLELIEPGLGISNQYEQEKADARVDKYMTKVVTTIEEDRSVETGLEVMLDNNIHSIPVTKDGRLVGIIGVRDIISCCF